MAKLTEGRHQAWHLEVRSIARTIHGRTTTRRLPLRTPRHSSAGSRTP